MSYSNIPLAQTVVALCKMHNIEHIVISPGSRNAPLTISFTHDDSFSCYSIVDERCAAFFALGIAQQLQKPVALVCTSGSALLNYYPAISEAYYSDIPLVVLSADRPKPLVDIGDGQTIKQDNVYGSHIHYSADLALDLREDAKHDFSSEFHLQKQIQLHNETEIHKALTTSVIKSGPVHINVPFDEPLYDRVNQMTIKPRIVQNPFISPNEEANEFNEILDIWNAANKKMILVGVLQPDAIEQKWLNELSKDENLIILTETTSNLHHESIFSEIDKLIAPLESSEFNDLQPDVLLTFGGMIVSKKIKAFLRNHQPKHHWHVGIQKANDTFFCLKHHFKLTPNTFLSSIIPNISIEYQGNYKSNWLKVRDRRRQLHVEYLKQIPFSDFTVFDNVIRTLPEKSQLHVGNSSAIRYTQLFQLPSDIKVFCNRGTSGIDGSTSTAVGAAVVSTERVTFITGDLSFFYDSNALWNNYIPKTFRIILINNQGGGIFRILPGHKNTENFDTYFETKHQLKARQLCDMFKFQYESASSTAELELKLDDFYKTSEGPLLLEVFTPERLNDEILLDYFQFVK